RDSVDGVCCADRVYEGVDRGSGLLPDLVAQGVVARDRVVIVELIRPEASGPRADFARGLDHTLDERFADALPAARHDREMGAERAHREALLRAERVREHDLRAIALDRAHEGQRYARRPARALDDRGAGTEP